MGATLGQLDKQGVEHPLAFASQKLSDTEMGWSTIEREVYALIWALNRFRDLIFGPHCSTFGSVPPKALNYSGGPWPSKSLIWSSTIRRNHTML